MTRPALALLFLTVLAGCQSVETQREKLRADAAVAQDLRRDPDAALIDGHPGLLRREGPLLQVGTGDATQEFRDRGFCEGFDTCERHRVEAVLNGRYVGMRIHHGEGSDFILIDGLLGTRREIGGRPHPSPSGALFFVGYHEEMGDWSPMMGAAVWRLTDSGTVAERLRLVDIWQIVFDEFVGWHGDRCAEFRGAPDYGRSHDPVRSYFIVDREGDWQLRSAPTAECAAP